MKTSAIIGGLALAGAGTYFYQLKKTGDSLVTDTQVKVKSFNLQRATLDVTVTMTNNGPTSLRIDNPVVEILHQAPSGKRTSLMKSKSPATATVHPGETTTFNLLFDTLTVAELAKLLGEQNYGKLLGQGLDLVVKTDTRVNFVLPNSDEVIENISLTDTALNAVSNYLNR